MRALVILGAVALIVVGCVAIALIYKRNEKARADRRRADLHEAKLHDLHRLAIEHQGAGSPLADLFEGELRLHLTNPTAKRGVTR